MPLQQMTFENIVAKGEIVQNEHLLLFPSCFQLCAVIIPPFIENFNVCIYMFSKLSAADILYMGNGKELFTFKNDEANLKNL